MQKDTAAFVASKRKRKRPANIKPVEAQPEIPKDLLDTWGAVKGFEKVHGLLKRGRYNFDEFQAVHDALLYVQSLFKVTLETAAKHPQAHLIPEIAEDLKHIEGQANGETTKTTEQ